MSIEPEYEIKFHLYDGNERETSRFVAQYQAIHDEKREEGSVMSRVLSYFFEGLIAIVDGDKKFWEAKYNEAYSAYQEASRMFNRFQNSRNVNARLDLFASRMISRSDGLIKLTESINTRDASLKEKLLSEALDNFNQEVNTTNKMNELMSSYAAFARASFTESQLLLVTARKYTESNSGRAKQDLLRARGSLRQASFIDYRFFYAIEEIESELDELTMGRLLHRAEINADKATVESENGMYAEAKNLFAKAVLFHKRASSLASDTGSRRKLLSSATLYEASMLEADGNQLFRRENNTIDASEKFSDAAKYVDKAIALIGHFGSKSLINSFRCQSDYYKAMSLQARGIYEFDNENYNVAKDLFEQANTQFKEAIELAKQGDNPVITLLGNEAIADINGYLSMCAAMMK
ncbi:MAG: hypothetical protein ACXAD7_16495 [Candidatus Kariarchaeaceae archaeon]|jgi:hypothetical protein